MKPLSGSRLPRGMLRPMLATLIDAPFDDREWVFETKWDGFRVVAHADGKGARLYSRNGRNVTRSYPALAAALGRIRRHAVVDGEVVALDSHGRSRFQLLQRAGKQRSRLCYCVFDLMYLDGKDLRRLSLIERKQRLRRLLPPSSLIRLSRHVRRNGVAAFRAAARRHQEGVIAKRAAGPYRSGRRTREWLKIKTAQGQEAVIIGFTRPARRKHFGALVLAVRRGKQWKYAGNAGTGFSESVLKSLHERLKKLANSRKPVHERVPNERSITWVRPRLVAQLKFTEWTSDGRMRHPAFLGLRSDKPASQVTRERPRRISK